MFWVRPLRGSGSFPKSSLPGKRRPSLTLSTRRNARKTRLSFRQTRCCHERTRFLVAFRMNSNFVRRLIRYTGNDLKNPSCWSDGSWTPTDESFVCALTLKGWTNRPSCFSFLERKHLLLCSPDNIFNRMIGLTRAFCLYGSYLTTIVCNGPSKCIFVRVVDTCAGCAEGSHHVDLTQAAFKKLASLDTGILNVNMRLASLPESAPWYVVCL